MAKQVETYTVTVTPLTVTVGKYAPKCLMMGDNTYKQEFDNTIDANLRYDMLTVNRKSIEKKDMELGQRYELVQLSYALTEVDKKTEVEEEKAFKVLSSVYVEM